MKYMGSKAKVARYIVPIIQKQIERSGCETYLEPFCGGCNVIDKIEAPQRIASDCNKYLIALMQYIQAGGELPGYIEREECAKVRANRDDYPEWYAGYVGFVASYNGRFFDGGYSGKTQTTGGLRDYQDEGRRNIEAQRDKLKDVIFLHKDYRAWNPTGCVIYMDPPYENTKQYKSVEIFDHADFWRVARLWSHDNIVLISEQEAPDDFVPVWIHSVTRTMNQNKTIAATEKLFVAKEVLEREEIVAAV